MSDEKKYVAPAVPEEKAAKGTKDLPKPRTNRDVLMDELKAHPVAPVAAHLPANIDDPVDPPPVMTPLTPEAQKKKDAKDALMKQIGDILAKYDNRESSVPAESEYWKLVAQARLVD